MSARTRRSGRDVAPPAVRCPACGGPTGPWSGYRRHLRADALARRLRAPGALPATAGGPMPCCPGSSPRTGTTRVDVIGAALELHVGGVGVRRIAAALGRPETTVREWCRRFGRAAADLGAGPARGRGQRRLVRASSCRPTPGPRAAAAVAALASAWTRRRGPVPPWRVAALVTGGRLLAPNTSLALGSRRRPPL